MSSEGGFLIVAKEAFHRPITLIWQRINEIVMKEHRILRIGPQNELTR
jgi:hypothetical protein